MRVNIVGIALLVLALYGAVALVQAVRDPARDWISPLRLHY